MKKKLLATLFTFTLFVMVYHTNVYTNRVNPPDGRTGAPNEGSCATAGCHGDGNSANAGDGIISLKAGINTPDIAIDDNFVYEPNTAYNISVSIDPLATVGTRYGFQLVVLDQNELVAGTFVINGNNAARTGLDNSGGRIYVEHRDADGSPSWVFEWTAPDSDVGPVTFYVAANAANANGNNSGDVIYEISQTISALSTGIADPAKENVHGVSVFPNPVSDNRINTAFETFGDHQVELSLYSLDGRLVQMFMREKMFRGNHELSWSLDNDLAPGVYMLTVSEGDKSSVKKILVR